MLSNQPVDIGMPDLFATNVPDVVGEALDLRMTQLGPPHLNLIIQARAQRPCPDEPSRITVGSAGHAQTAPMTIGRGVTGAVVPSFTVKAKSIVPPHTGPVLRLQFMPLMAHAIETGRSGDHKDSTDTDAGASATPSRSGFGPQRS
jgi:hypothetical protein